MAMRHSVFGVPFSSDIFYAPPSVRDLVEFKRQFQELVGFATWLQDKYDKVPAKELDVLFKSLDPICVCNGVQ